MGRTSAFKSDAARAEYCRLYDEAIAQSPGCRSRSRTYETSLRDHARADRRRPVEAAARRAAREGDELDDVAPAAALTLTPVSPRADARQGRRPQQESRDGAVPSPRRVVEWMCDTLGTLGIDRAALVGGVDRRRDGRSHFAMSHGRTASSGLALVGSGGHRESPSTRSGSPS